MRVPIKEHMSRLNRVVGHLNVWLFAIALGLAVLDFSVLVVKSVEALPPPPADTSAATAPAHSQPG